jgi:hypothetical protein
MIIFDDKTGSSEVGVTFTVDVGVDVNVGSSVGVCVRVGVNPTGVSVNETLAAIAVVDEHPLLCIAARINRIT